ncbi:type II toxin-antitoxin system RelE/ParE family toxin [Parabacteroides sp.]
MAKRIEWTPTAQSNVEQITFFYKPLSQSYTTKLIRLIKASIDLLETNPQLGFVEPLLESCPACFRSLVIGYYKIVYWIDKETIYIAYIFDCRQSPDKLKEIPNNVQIK